MKQDWFGGLTEEMVRAVARRAGFGGDVESLRFPGQGVNNQTCLVRLTDGRQLAVKARPGGREAGTPKQPVTGDNPFWPRYTRALFGDFPNGDIETLPAVTALLREHGAVRVPEVYRVDDSFELVAAPYAVSECLAGAAHAFTVDPMTPRAAAQLGEHLARVHAGTAGDTWGVFDRRGEFTAEAWWPRFADAYRTLYRELAARSDIMRDLERPLFAALERAAATGTPASFPLICLDNAPTHYLRADDGGIAAMVDVEGHLWAPREYELAMVELWLGSQRCAMWAGYERAAERPTAQPAVRDAYQWMTWMEWTYCNYTLLNDPAEARRMEELLAEKCARAVL